MCCSKMAARQRPARQSHAVPAAQRQRQALRQWPLSMLFPRLKQARKPLVPSVVLKLTATCGLPETVLQWRPGRWWARMRVAESWPATQQVVRLHPLRHAGPGSFTWKIGAQYSIPISTVAPVRCGIDSAGLFQICTRATYHL